MFYILFFPQLLLSFRDKNIAFILYQVNFILDPPPEPHVFSVPNLLPNLAPWIRQNLSFVDLLSTLGENDIYGEFV